MIVLLNFNNGVRKNTRICLKTSYCWNVFVRSSWWREIPLLATNIHVSLFYEYMQLSLVSRLKCEYFVELLGYCLEANNRILVYQYATKGSLHDVLHGTHNKFFFFSFPINFIFRVFNFKINLGIFFNIYREKGCNRGRTWSSPQLGSES